MLPIDYQYKIYDASGNYIGLLPNVTSPFNRPQDINSAGSQIVITVSTKTDVASETVEPIETETPAPLQTEASETITTEGSSEVLGDESEFIRNGYGIVVIEISDWNPNGVVVFRGTISKWGFNTGTSNVITVTCINDGFDLDQHILSSGPQVDYSQTTHNASYGLYTGTTTATTRKAAQLIGGNASGLHTNASGVSLYLAAQNGSSPSTVTVRITSVVPGDLYEHLLSPDYTVAQAEIVISSTTPQEYFFGFDTLVPYDDMFHCILVDASGASGSGVNIYYNTTGPILIFPMNVFNGTLWDVPTGSNDVLHIKIWNLPDVTLIPFSGIEIKTALTQIMDIYSQEDGVIAYSDSSLDSTGVDVTIDFQLNTVLEGIKTFQSLAPANYYWYVDDDNLLNFKMASSTADHVFIKGEHIGDLDFSSDIEAIKNISYFTGGKVGATNLMVKDSNTDSIAQYRYRLARPSNNRVTDASTGHVINNATIDHNEDERYVTVITVHASKYDISTIHVGHMVALRGYRMSIIDNVLMQVVRTIRTPFEIKLYLGAAPLSQTLQVEEINRQLSLVQTVDNPSSPS